MASAFQLSCAVAIVQLSFDHIQIAASRIENSRLGCLSCHILPSQIQLSGGFELTLQNFTLAVLPFRRIKKLCFAQKLLRKAKLAQGCKKLLQTPNVAQLAEHNRDRPYCTSMLWSFDSFQKSLSAEGAEMSTHPGYQSFLKFVLKSFYFSTNRRLNSTLIFFTTPPPPSPWAGLLLKVCCLK